MAIGPRLDLRQSQSLVMTPQLQQAIRLLQLSAVELVEYVDQELEANPLLERDESGGEGSLSEAMGNADDRSEDGMSIVDSVDEQPDAAMDIDEGLTENDAAYDTAPDAAGSMVSVESSSSSSGGSFDDMQSDLEQTLSETEDLRSHLDGQLNLTVMAASDRLIATALIDSLDESGYLSGDLEALAEQLGAPLETIEAVLGVLQSFDPAGLFARDLKECLALQLQDRNRYDPAIEALIENLDLLAKRDFNALKNLCNADTEDLRDMIEEVRALDPKPALRFETSVSYTVIPDVIMTPIPDGGWRVELNAETLPKVLINNQYYAELNQPGSSKEEKTFVAEKFQSATWLVRALEQRATTILKVSTAFVGKQDAFFRKGVTFLRPLILKDIAELTELHESTVSRVTNNKFIATPRGIYELKYFFSHGLTRSDGEEATSAEAVRHRIKQMVNDESLDAILSDDQIVEKLRQDGIKVARRTVAKYRESLKIPSSVQRRRQKANDLPMT
ncbi:MAG: RNA polymerase factor sigma-54 [Rhodospirillaceae bacterium]|nr:RNA polymerase factor sigma-54 [Rhodospirillaceae bacterium]